MEIPLRVLCAHGLDLGIVLARPRRELGVHLSVWPVGQVHLLVVLVREPEGEEELARIQLLVLVLAFYFEFRLYLVSVRRWRHYEKDVS